MITEAEKAISGSKTAEFQSLSLGSFSCYLDPKLLITLSFLPSADLAAVNLPSIKEPVDRTIR